MFPDLPRNQILIKVLWAVIIVLAALLIAPYVVNRNPPTNMAEMSSGMMMKTFYLDNTGAPVPTVSFTLTKDTLDGWDLHINTTNFTFTPQNINQAPIADQGHVHLYIDGNLTVVFGPWFHISGDQLPPGTHTIVVSLNANDHSIFSYGGKNIQAMQTLVVSPI
jgi:hypothetical protein